LAETVVLLGSEAGEILIVQPRAPKRPGQVERIAIPRHVDAFARSPDGSTVYFTARDLFPDRALHALDLRTLDLVRTRSIAELLGSELTQEIVDTGGEAITVSPDGSTIFIAGWRSDQGELGVGMVDAETFQETGFIGPLRVRRHGLATLPASQDRPQGAVLALGRRVHSMDSSTLSLFVIDPGTGAIVDSLTGPAPDTSAYQLVPAADGRHVYLNGVFSLARYDLDARMLRERVDLPTLGWLTLAPDGQELYRTDQKVNLTTPGEGRVFIFGPALDSRAPVDLSSYEQDGSPPVTLSAAQSRDGEHLYVVTGTGSFGHGRPYQPGRLFVVRLADRSVERVVDLDSWNVGPPIVLR
jgi:hypothetical protein